MSDPTDWIQSNWFELASLTAQFPFWRCWCGMRGLC
jgi:hypothetical protein